MGVYKDMKKLDRHTCYACDGWCVTACKIITPAVPTYCMHDETNEAEWEMEGFEYKTELGTAESCGKCGSRDDTYHTTLGNIVTVVCKNCNHVFIVNLYSDEENEK